MLNFKNYLYVPNPYYPNFPFRHSALRRFASRCKSTSVENCKAMILQNLSAEKASEEIKTAEREVTTSSDEIVPVGEPCWQVVPLVFLEHK
jgi:hypothetical protein